MILESAVQYYLGTAYWRSLNQLFCSTWNSFEQRSGDPEESYSVLRETLEQLTGGPGDSWSLPSAVLFYLWLVEQLSGYPGVGWSVIQYQLLRSIWDSWSSSLVILESADLWYSISCSVLPGTRGAAHWLSWSWLICDTISAAQFYLGLVEQLIGYPGVDWSVIQYQLLRSTWDTWSSSLVILESADLWYSISCSVLPGTRGAAHWLSWSRLICDTVSAAPFYLGHVEQLSGYPGVGWSVIQYQLLRSTWDSWSSSLVNLESADLWYSISCSVLPGTHGAAHWLSWSQLIGPFGPQTSLLRSWRVTNG